MPRTPQKLQEVFEKHIGYEIDRLAEMYHLLLKPDTYKCVPESVRDTIADALIVGFCIHAKTLMEFLSRDPQNHFAASADYADSYEPWKITSKSRAHELKGKLNNQLSHLSYERTDDPNEKIGVQERKELLEMIHDELVRWRAHLKPNYDGNKLNIGALATAKSIVIDARALRQTTTTSTAATWCLTLDPRSEGPKTEPTGSSKR